MIELMVARQFFDTITVINYIDTSKETRFSYPPF